MKCLLIGDIHAGKKRNSNIFHQILLDYGKWIKEICHRNDIKHIIQLGDIYDNRFTISAETHNCVNSFIDELEEFTMDIIVGNHDAMLNDNASVNWLTPLNKHPNITVHDKITVRDEMVFAGWGVKLEDIPPCKLFFGHIDTIGFELQKNKISTHGFKASDLMDKVSGAAFTGHYHLPQTRTYDRKPLCYVGSAFSLDWNDQDSKKYVYILDTDTLEVTQIHNNASPIFIHIANETQLEQVNDNFVSINYVIGEEGEKWKRTIQNLKPLEIKTYKIQEKVQQIDSDIEQFKVIDIRDTLGSWPIDNLNNIPEHLKIKIAEKAKLMYDKHI
jgi:DNA repair exonuclease SbcCD nuclease subunit